MVSAKIICLSIQYESDREEMEHNRGSEDFGRGDEVAS
jgi:hypothetical protein